MQRGVTARAGARATRRRTTRRAAAVLSAVLIAAAIVPASAHATRSDAPGRATNGDDAEVMPDEHPDLTPLAQLAVSRHAAAAIGQWGAPFTPSGAVTAIHMVLLRTGKVLMWSTHRVMSGGAGYEEQAIAAVFDPVTRRSTRVDPPVDDNIFCGDATTLPDGRILVVGGLDPYHGYSGQGIPVVLVFDPTTERWTAEPNMRQGRWYPSLVRLADGRTVAIGGHAGGARNVPNYDVEVFSSSVGAPQLVGQYRVGAGEDMYPTEIQAPDGRVFSIASKFTHFIDPTTGTVTNGPPVLGNEYTYPNATILPLTPNGHFVVQVTGGRSGGPQTAWPATATSVRIDLSVAHPVFQAMRAMPQARTNTNTVLLPDGTMLLVGGNQAGNVSLPAYQTLLYTPATDTWTPVASQAKRRAYHSTALLLPDGTVLSGGDNATGGGNDALEVYSPSYLFAGTRPSITSAPSTALRGGSLTVTTSTSVQKLVLVAPGATTHATDLAQRLVELTTVPTSGSSLTATLPSDVTLPAGPYMLFALDAAGVPSIAKWVMVS